MNFTARSFVRSSVTVGLTAALSLMVACSSGTGAEGTDDQSATTHTDSSWSTTIHSVYGMTTFGGPGDYQAMACGQNSRTSQPYYVASSQRYGCNVHLRLQANGKCIVVQTEDIGPASWVEADAETPILDSSPVVADYLFNTDSLGWSDLKGTTKYDVKVDVTTLALGPCSSSAPSPTPDAGAPTPAPDAGKGSGKACTNDGACNPGSDGSGMICVSGECVEGCNANWECPGNTSCHSGVCK